MLPIRRKTTYLLLAIFASLLQGCIFEPGTHMPYFADKTDIFSEDVVFRENGEVKVGKVLVKPITADLIVHGATPSLYEGMGAKGAKTDKTGGKPNPMTYYQYRLGLGVSPPTPSKYYEYRIGPRDVLNITIWDHPELTIPQGQFRSAESSGTVVKEDGTIFYAYAGVIKAAGMTREELRRVLTERLSQFIEQPQVEVAVSVFRSKRVYVVGEVAKPGRIAINDIPLTTVEAIHRADGFTQNADRRNVTLTRDGKTYRVDMQALYEAGDFSQEILLQDGDVLNIPDRTFDKVFVMGEVKQANAFPMPNGRMTLAEAIGLAGGVDNVAANPGRVFVIRSGKGEPEIFSLDARAPDAMLLSDEFMLQPHDVVFVDTAEITRWNRLITQILPTATTLQVMSGTTFPLYSTRPGF